MSVEKFPIEASHIMMFARAIGDPNPIYYDAERAQETEVGGIIAPPTFVAAAAQFDPEFSLRPKPGRAWLGSGREATGIARTESSGGTGLHAEQHYEYFRPLGPGDTLSVRSREGRTWQKEGRRGGLLTFRESITEFLDETGEIVLRARSVAVRTERTVKADH